MIAGDEVLLRRLHFIHGSLALLLILPDGPGCGLLSLKLLSLHRASRYLDILVMLVELLLEVRVLFSLRLHYALDRILVLVDRDVLDQALVVERDCADFHANRLLQVASPGVVNPAAGLLAALDRVSLGQLGALLDDLVRDLTVVVNRVW